MGKRMLRMGLSGSSLLLAITLMSSIQIIKADGEHRPKRDLFAPQESVLDMALSSYDDQYKGCSDMMEAEIAQLFQIEYSTNKEFAEAWDSATFKWEEKKPFAVVPQGFKDQYAIAILAYTINGPLHKVFNAAVREAGRSRQYYLNTFRFKVLHYYLTKALQMLDAIEKPNCHRVFRGTRGIRFKSETKTPIRFGQFTSSSLNDQNALAFGEDTFFNIQTCYGVNIKNFSFFPGEEEVLIPPYEKFKVTNFARDKERTLINLQSLEKASVYNCEYVKEKRCKSKLCLFNSASSFRMNVFTPEIISLFLLPLQMYWIS
ncbi:GPI-linked NAD(P)(+)--arginine ADP-ribosyltransferase 1 isoform X2 [Bombina bombina]|uniref:GPI-linked NAD(P)(+)--arginine ADP-ribosyltransferase 1 isoform X2 n=1 Tax=Bombina bombina TaxID=8345 RepID=UPI00235A4B03|nr:GPI-linked NAD(P)(+)--arginine ADP-ribosyltransferase 1 isoform X2 [Bombina bombina]